MNINYVTLVRRDRKILDEFQTVNGFHKQWVLQWLNRQLEKQTQYATLISHEELSGHPHGYTHINPYATARNIKALAPKAKILIIIRNQFDYILSLYAYRVAIKGLESRSFPKFLQKEGNKGLFDHLCYTQLIHYYQKLFGHDAVCVLPFEQMKASPDKFIEELSRFMQVDTPYIPSREKINVSTKKKLIIQLWRAPNLLFKGFLYFLRFFKKNTTFIWWRYKYYALKRQSTSLLNPLCKRTPNLSFKQNSKYHALVNKFGQCNKQLEKLTDLDLSQWGYPVKK